MARPALVFLAVALLTRVWLFGNPIVHIDEQFYLLVGDRMWRGDLPYVDIWDRKPIGLFLIYAAARLFGGDGVIQYQLMALLSAAATALLIHRIALRVATPGGAMAAGIAYLLFLIPFNGSGGQSPVFYDLLVALAALGTLSLVTQQRPERLALKGAGVMLLLGAAIQVKYTVVFEGGFFGLMLLWRAWRDGARAVQLLGLAALWIGCALLPTMITLGSYAAMGHADAFIQANFLSIFGRQGKPWSAFMRLLIAIAVLSPFWATILFGRKALDQPFAPEAGVQRFLIGWALAAIGGYLIFGSYYDHYTLPLLLPLGVLASPWLGRGGSSWLFTAPVLILGTVLAGAALVLRIEEQGDRAGAERMAALVASRLNGCLYVYEGDPALYRMTNACFATRFVFPSHLNNFKEANALGVDVKQEVRRILATRPSVIVMAAEPRENLSNLETRAIMLDELPRSYRFVAEVRNHQKRWRVWALK